MNAEDSSPRSRAVWVALALAALTATLYGPVGDFEFVNYDDPEYVAKNPVVAQGLSAEGARWAFTTFHAANWHPLTWLSHMLDVELFDLRAGGHHLVSAGLHALDAVLLFLALRALTQRLAPSALVAALFALHPLRVESAAWVSERKDLLAGAFFCALLLLYARHARSPGVGSYALVVLALALGCLAKPVLVTAPFVLLLLDHWPLRRFGSAPPAPAMPSLAPTHPGGKPRSAEGGSKGSSGSLRRGSPEARAARRWPKLWSAKETPRRVRAGFTLVLEKLPLLAIAAASSAVTVIAQRAGGAVGTFQALPLADRIVNAGAAYLAYLRATVWPARLAVFYPHPAIVSGRPLLAGIAGGLLVLALTLLSLRCARRAPWLLTGWGWFAGMLVPVIGLVQVGDQAWADRYAYLPTVGLYLAAVFGLAELVRRRPALAPPAWIAALAVLVALGVVSARQIGSWKDSRTLFERALRVTDGNWVAHNNLGLVYLERRELDRALGHFEQAVAIHPGFVQARFNRALALETSGRIEEAVSAYRAVLELRPGHPETLLRLAVLARASGEASQARAFHEQAVEANPADPLPLVAFARVLLEDGELDRAENCAESALRLDPRLAEAELVLGELALKGREVAQAERRFERAIELAPEAAEAHAALARCRQIAGDVRGARAELDRALALDPDLARARYDLGLLLLKEGERAAARAQFQAVLDVLPGDPAAMTALAGMLIEEGKPAEAIPILLAALERKADIPSALFNLAQAYELTGEWKKAAENYEKLLAIPPPDPDAACALASILATGPDPELFDGEKAVKVATYAVQHLGARAADVLAAAFARKGDFEQAVRWQQEAIAGAGDPKQRNELEERLRLFESHRAYTRSP